MFNFFDHDNGFTKSGLPSPTKQSMGLELYLCGTYSYGAAGNGQSGGGGGLPSSGALSLSDIQDVHGGSNPISLSEYYGAGSGVPSSGTITVDDFYSTAPFPLSGLSLFIDPGNTSCYSGSGTTINDLSSTQTSSMTLVGGTYNSSNGGYFDMSGNGSHIKLNSKTNIDRVVKGFTWHMFIDQDGNNSSLVACGKYFEPPAHHIWFDTSSRIRFNTVDDSGGSSGTATGYQIRYENSSVIGSSWTHCAVVVEIGSCSYGTLKVYINGSLTDTSSLGGQSNAPSGQDYVLFSNSDSSNLYAFDGKVGVVMYYSKAQSATEVGDVYDAFKSRYGLT